GDADMRLMPVPLHIGVRLADLPVHRRDLCSDTTTTRGKVDSIPLPAIMVSGIDTGALRRPCESARCRSIMLERTDDARGMGGRMDRPGTSAAVSVGRQTIITGDSASVLTEIPPASIDVVVTSPPYNIGLAYNSYDDGGSRPAYLAWLRGIGQLLKQVLRDDGSFFLNIAGTNSDPWIAADVAEAMRDLFALQNNIVWVKSISI